MNGIYSCIIAVSMYSKIPMPAVEWTEERMRHVMCFFPFV
ncbi:adenosylcobinamide-GDP ribazoletransferase, partial [Enterocloster hominis]